MRQQERSLKALFFVVLAAMLMIMALVTALGYWQSGAIWVLIAGGSGMCCAVLALVVMMQVLAVRLQRFSDDLCACMDAMTEGSDTAMTMTNSEMLFDRISQRLTRLYDVQQAQERKLADERRALQELVSDIAHQVRQPLASLQMITDTLLEQPVDASAQRAFLCNLRGQADKLAFLLQALVKTSRLEAGLIHIEKRSALLYETVARALGASVTQAEKKNMTVTVDCDEAIVVNHDSRWTAEALANLVDNAVKYTPSGGHLAVTVHVWELYAEICVRDDGPGIPESEQAQIFARFYRGQAAKNTAGVGIGLYLAREIVTRQGGYIRLRSEPGQGAVFSIMLPLRD